MAAESRIIEVEDIGTIELKKNDKARRLSIRIVPFKGVQVTIPRRGSFAEAERFIGEKKTWIIKSIEKIRKHESKFRIIDEHTQVQTRNHTLKIIFE